MCLYQCVISRSLVSLSAIPDDAVLCIQAVTVMWCAISVFMLLIDGPLVYICALPYLFLPHRFVKIILILDVKHCMVQFLPRGAMQCCACVCPSVCYKPVLFWNGYTYDRTNNTTRFILRNPDLWHENSYLIQNLMALSFSGGYKYGWDRW